VDTNTDPFSALRDGASLPGLKAVERKPAPGAEGQESAAAKPAPGGESTKAATSELLQVKKESSGQEGK